MARSARIANSRVTCLRQPAEKSVLRSGSETCAARRAALRRTPSSPKRRPTRNSAAAFASRGREPTPPMKMRADSTAPPGAQARRHGDAEHGEVEESRGAAASRSSCAGPDATAGGAGRSGSRPAAGRGAGCHRRRGRRRGPHLPRVTVSQRALAARTAASSACLAASRTPLSGRAASDTHRLRVGGRAGGWLQDAHYRSRITVWSSCPPSEIRVANSCTRLRPQGAPPKPAMPQALTGRARTAQQVR
jgi:hypothetical protein